MPAPKWHNIVKSRSSPAWALLIQRPRQNGFGRTLYNLEIIQHSAAFWVIVYIICGRGGRSKIDIFRSGGESRGNQCVEDSQDTVSLRSCSASMLLKSVEKSQIRESIPSVMAAATTYLYFPQQKEAWSSLWRLAVVITLQVRSLRHDSNTRIELQLFHYSTYLPEVGKTWRAELKETFNMWTTCEKDLILLLSKYLDNIRVITRAKLSIRWYISTFSTIHIIGNISSYNTHISRLSNKNWKCI